MSKAYVLLTAMPPTTGHLQLIQFANRVADDGVVVILCTQPHEPMAQERYMALTEAISHLQPAAITLKHFDKTIEQDPATPGFWPMWQKLMTRFGITKDDIIVASERYGQRLAELTGTQFFPYDLSRDLNPAKATYVRDNPELHFDAILPEFRPFITTTVTVFGAESTGKTTLSRELANHLNGTWLFEYARPYLESTINEITPRSMNAIWKGQTALQEQGKALVRHPLIVQDTDLFSTVGYWQFPHWKDQLGDCPQGLISDALRLKSDLYIITKSNIPFEADPLRYGGDVREGSDDYWINVCEEFDLPYIVLESSSFADRLEEASDAIKKLMNKKASCLSYDRHGL